MVLNRNFFQSRETALVGCVVFPLIENKARIADPPEAKAIQKAGGGCHPHLVLYSRFGFVVLAWWPVVQSSLRWRCWRMRGWSTVWRRPPGQTTSMRSTDVAEPRPK